MGRKTKLTPEVQKVICDDLAVGLPRWVAAESAGINAATLGQWLARGLGDEPQGRPQTPLYVAFVAAVKEAERRCIRRNVALIQKAAQDGTWTAAAWWLERRVPEDFARRDRLDLGGQKDNPIRVKDETPYDFDAMRITFRRLVGSNGTGGDGADGDSAQESVHSALPMVKAGTLPDRLG